MSPAAKRILLVAHNFPPLGSGGVHRPVKFARYLRELGWDVEVLTVKDIRYHAYDPSLLAEVEGIPVHRAGSLEVLRLFWLAGWRPPDRDADGTTGFADLERRARERRGAAISSGGRFYKALSRHLLQPDNELPWVPFAVARGRALLRRRRFDVVLSTSPPESCHFVGMALQRRAGVKWVADFRDAWSRHHLRRDLWTGCRGLNRAWERRVLRAADGLVANNDAMAADMRALAGKDVRLLTLPNGFDPAELTPPLPKAAPGDFVVVHNGSFRGGRRANVILEAWARARAADAAFASRAKLYLIGINRDDDRDAARALGLGDVVFDVGYVAHAEAVRACAAADLLLLAMAPEEGASLIPGKVYEYLGTGRPILAAVPEGAARDLLARAATDAKAVPPADAAAIAAALLEAFRRAAAGISVPGRPSDAATAFARPGQVAALSSFLEGVL